MPGVAAPLLEREPHLEAAQDALAAALDGAGSTLLALGEGGVGKTELLAEVTRAARPSFTVLRARGDELEQDYPFGVVRQLLDPPLRRLDDREAAFVGAAEHAKAVFDLRSEAAMDASFAHLQGLLWVVVHLSEALGPLLLVVDDAHRADDISLRFLRFLSHRLDGLPVALLLATRPSEQIENREPLAAMLDDPACRVLHVDRLSAAATADYLATTWDPAAAELASVAHALTNGNPLMLRELVAEAGRAGLQPHRTGPDDLRELGPRSITSRVRRSLASAPPAASILAQALAVLGDDVAATELVRFAQVDTADAGPALDALLRLNVLEDGADGLRFAHPLVRASVAQLLSPVEREAAHARAARALHERGAPPHRVAAHVLATAPIGERWAADALTAAADRALSLSAPASAARYLARALDEPLPDPPATLAQLALAESHAGLPTALERFEAALEAADDPGQIPFQYAGALAMAGRTAQAFDALREVVGEPAGAPPVLRANLHAAAVFTDAPDALALRDAIAASAGREPPSRAPGWPLVAAMEAFELAVRGAPAQDVAAILEPAVLGPGLQLDLASTSVYGYGIWAMILSERFDLARREVDRAIAEGRESGELVVLGLGLLLRCGVLGRQGSLLLAEADGMQTLMLSELPSWRFGAPAATQFLVDVLLDQGRSAEAAALLDKLPGRIEPGVGNNVDVLLWACRTRVLLAERRHAEALEAALATGRWVKEARLDAPALTYWREAAARAAAALGRAQEAEEHAAAAVAGARAVGGPAGLARALLLDAEVGPVAARDERLAEATECAERCASPLVQARARLAAGRAERVAGRPADAREPLREAVELATEIGARPVVDAALEELAASGAKPRRAAYGRDLLTAAESRVARLAADGVTNREIAQALFVTQKTVETHLSSAYRKLSISSRAQLAAHLDP